MYYGIAGYAEDLQAWENATRAREAWELSRAALEAQWRDYEAERLRVEQQCAEKLAAYQTALANRDAYAARYEADLDACQRRKATLDALAAQINQWKSQYNIVGQFSSPPCASLQIKQEWANECERMTTVRGLGYAYQDVSSDANFRSVIDARTNQPVACLLKDLPTCPGRLPACEDLPTPGPIYKPTCTYPDAPPSLRTLGPMPPTPGRRPTPPDSIPDPDLPRLPDDEDEGSSSFALYGILAFVLIGGSYLVYRTVK